MEKNSSLVSKIILTAVLVLVGSILVGIVADTTKPFTSYTNTTQEAHAITIQNNNVSETAVYTVNYVPTETCPITNFAIRNQSGHGKLTVTTDYTVNLAAGTYLLKNTTATGPTGAPKYIGAYNNTYIDYERCGTGYLDSSWGRSVLQMIAAFLALVLFAFAIGVLYSIYKDVTD